MAVENRSLQIPLGGGILKAKGLVLFLKPYFMSEKYKPSEEEINKERNNESGRIGRKKSRSARRF